MIKEELKHQSKVVAWCRKRSIKIGATAQSTWTNSWKAINENRMAGVVKGLPDLILIIPPKYRKNGLGKVLHIEMKRPKGGVISKEQKIWIEALDTSMGVSAQVCKGYTEAIEYIKSFIEIEPKEPTLKGKKLENFIRNL